MKKYLTNTYLNIILFVLFNLIISNLIKNFSIINEYIFMLIDFIITLIILLIYSYYYSFNENLTQKKIILELLTISITGSFLIALSKYIYFEFINHKEIDNLLNEMRNQLQSEGYSGSQINQAMSFSAIFTTPIAISIMSFLGYSFSSIIGSIISPKFFSKK